jgi:outer membrane protein OmpA-like peptidoglycan-associated protein
MIIRQMGWAVLALMMFGASAVNAQDAPSSEEIVDQLLPSAATRSARGVTVTPGQEVEKPSVNLYVNFEFDSARLDNDGVLVLRRLGAALNDRRLATYRFEIAGHTDAAGSADYNQKLSEERAHAVTDYLTTIYGIDPTRLVSIGYGKSQLLDPAKPNDGVNRRVRITNLSD